MGKRSQRRRPQSRKYQGGCMGGLISMFDFRHTQSSKNLLLDRKHDSEHPGDGGYSAAESEILAYSNEKSQTTKFQDPEGSGLDKAGASKTSSSVKELLEEDMSTEQDLKKNKGASDVQLDRLNSEHDGHVKGKPKQVNKYRSKSCDIEHVIDWGVSNNSSDQVLDHETLNHLDMGVILEEFCRLNHKGFYVKQESQNAVGIKSHNVKSLAEENLAAAIEVFINQRFGNNKDLAEDGRTHNSNQLMDALKTLSLNKELLFELLQDPNSLLMKHIHNIEDGQLDKDQNTRSISKQIEEEPNKPIPDELASHKHRRIFRRRSKSQDSNFLKDYENQSSSRIVILKPGPAVSINSGTDPLDDKFQSARNYSHFSLNEIKRRLKHAMGKNRHGISLNDNFPRQFSSLRINEKGLGEGNGGWSSPNRDHFYTERFAKSPLGIKKVDKIGHPKQSRTTMEYATNEITTQGVSNLYVEAKKHLSEMLSNGDKKEELVERQLPKSLGRVLSLPEYITPSGSPGKPREHSSVIPEMKLSLGSNFHMVNENTWRLIQETHLIQLSSPKQNFDRPSFIANDESDEKLHSPRSDSDGLGDGNQENLPQVPMSSVEEETICEASDIDAGELESLRITSADFKECIQSSEVSRESSTTLFISENESCDAAPVNNEENDLTSIKLNLGEGDEFLYSPQRSPSSPSVSSKVETHASCIDKAERPSPISVLEPLFSEDDISPSNTKREPVTATVQPLHIQFEEQFSSNPDQTVCTRTCMDDEESAFEYVEAVLLGSDLNWDEYLLRWLSSDQVLDPSLFDDVELFSSRSSHDQRLLFDCTNDVLKDLCEHYFGHSFVKHNIRIIPRGMKLINEVWEGVERLFNQPPAPQSLDQLVRRDMSKHGKWMDLRVETDHIGIDLENSILEELMEDTILTFYDNFMKLKFPTSPCESVDGE